ncbi:MAG: cytoplasmic protein, partial [Clostridiales bacterium]|nr:cytoplasmic protein [Clostridiales bacterium]
VLEQNQALGLPMLADMFGHVPMAPWAAEGYQVISM